MSGAYKDVETVLDTNRTVVGEPLVYPASGPARLTASLITIGPGEDTKLHSHDVPVFVYVLSGELTVNYGASGTKRYGAGQGFLEAMSTSHAGRNTGSQETRLLAVFLGTDKSLNTVS